MTATFHKYSPEEFMAYCEKGGTLGPTDKNYKVYIGERAMEGKFYFEELSEEQRTRFIELLNNKVINIGYPGYFYVAPFFCKVITLPHD